MKYITTAILLFILSTTKWCAEQTFAAFLPAGTTASRWTSNMVLCYMDARSTGAFGPIPKQLFSWDSYKFARLLAYHNESIDVGGGYPIDTLFDSYLFNAYKWYDGKDMWPGVGKSAMNSTDWLGLLNLFINGSDSLELAAKNMSALLPFTASSKLRPSLVLAVPYPDPRQEDFGIIESIDPHRSLNFSTNKDRIDAVQWWIQLAYDHIVEKKKYEYVDFKGFYWFLEKIPTNDPPLLKSVSDTIHNFGKSRSLMFVWIPYYRPGDPHTGMWKELGFDFSTLQPNYAFGNVTAQKRFPEIRALCENDGLGVELELPYHIRNADESGWEDNFNTYLQQISNWEKETSIDIMKTYYYGNIFVQQYSGNKTNFEFYKKLYEFVKGV